MKFWNIVAVIFIIIGVLFTIFFSMLDDREVEGPSGAVSPGAYFFPVLLIIIGGGIIFLLVRSKNTD